MPRLVIQINTTVPQDDFSWLRNALLNRLGQFNHPPLDLTPLVLLEHPMPEPVQNFAWANDKLYNVMMPIIQHSPNKITADQNGDWFVSLFVTTRHQQGYLGLMYDLGIGNHSRQGCAIFWEEIKNITGPNVQDFERVVCRTALHEIGHCLNLVHDDDLTLMDQTRSLQDANGPGWISQIDFSYAPGDIGWVINNPGESMPGGPHTNFGLGEDIGRSSKGLDVTLKEFTDNRGAGTLSGAPVGLLVTLEKNKLSPILFSKPLTLEAGGIKVWVTAPGGQETLIKNPVVGCDTVFTGITMAENTMHFPLYIFRSPAGYLFDEAGNYSIRIAVKGSGKNWHHSKPLDLKIREAYGVESDQKKLLNKRSLVRFMLLGSTKTSGTNNDVHKTIDLAPDSEISRAILWQKVYALKAKLNSLKSEKPKKRLKSQLVEVYKKLVPAETSAVRKGKVLSAIQILNAELGQYLEEPAVDPQTVQSYLDFEKKLIKKIIPNK